ncbi:MAG: PEP-CTERM sorting domain-containing protein [Alphaproteobacteria bacterium]|nr:PEP-CTERM sorting domain-containing protein [Alphaproteobacteria bacterium]
MANTQYIIGAEVFNGSTDAWTDVNTVGGSGFGYGSGIVNAVSTNTFASGGFAAPQSNGGGVNLRWGPANATFTTMFDDIPEPGTILIFGLGLAGVGFMRSNARRKKVVIKKA